MAILDEIVAHKRRQVAAMKRAQPPQDARQRLRDRIVRNFIEALRQPGLSVIAEFKRRSPSRGVLRVRRAAPSAAPLVRESLLAPRPGSDVSVIARLYEDHHARALSVLTDEQYFGGSPADLIAARRATSLPALRKDFIVDAVQLFESASIGTDAVLLIVRILDDAQLAEYMQIARDELALPALVEVHDDRELDRALRAGAQIVGINNRNLDTFEVSLETCLQLRRHISDDVITVAESGIHARDDFKRVEDAGFDAVLIGESLMAADHPGEKLNELRGVYGWQEGRSPA